MTVLSHQFWHIRDARNRTQVCCMKGRCAAQFTISQDPQIYCLKFNPSAVLSHVLSVILVALLFMSDSSTACDPQHPQIISDCITTKIGVQPRESTAMASTTGCVSTTGRLCVAPGHMIIIIVINNSYNRSSELHGYIPQNKEYNPVLT